MYGLYFHTGKIQISPQYAFFKKYIKAESFQHLTNRTKALERKYLTLSWTIADSDGSLFSKGKHNYYAIIIRGIPQEHPKDCVIELYVTNKEMTIVEIKVNPHHEQVRLLSRFIVLGNLQPIDSISEVIEEMKVTAERREKENPYSSISTDYNSK